MKNIFISGASGFIGTHIVIEGLKRGYTITGTTRSMHKEGVLREIVSAHLGEEALSRLIIYYCDLNSPDGWADAMKGCNAILHVASPFPMGLPKHEDDLILPARNGVKHVFEAALQNNIHRIVQTSSIAAIMYGHESGKTDFTEEDFTNINGAMISPYTKSKALAEQDVWKYAKQHPELKVSVINPGFVLGPLLNKEIGTSGDVILKLMKGEFPGVPKLGFPIVDVRDVAAAHYNALENDLSIGQRYATVSESFWFKEIAKAILDAYPTYNKKVKAKELPNWFLKIFSLFDKPTRMIIDELGFCAIISNDKLKRDLKIQPIAAKDAIQATAKSLVDLKLV